MKAILATCVVFLGCALSPEVAAQEAPLSPNAEAAIGAATSFAVGYGVWLWEKKCAKLPPEESAAFSAAVTGQMQRFSGMLDLSSSRQFSARVRIPRKTPHRCRLARVPMRWTSRGSASTW